MPSDTRPLGNSTHRASHSPVHHRGKDNPARSPQRRSSHANTRASPQRQGRGRLYSMSPLSDDDQPRRKRRRSDSRSPGRGQTRRKQDDRARRESFRRSRSPSRERRRREDRPVASRRRDSYEAHKPSTNNREGHDVYRPASDRHTRHKSRSRSRERKRRDISSSRERQHRRSDDRDRGKRHDGFRERARSRSREKTRSRRSRSRETRPRHRSRSSSYKRHRREFSRSPPRKNRRSLRHPPSPSPVRRSGPLLSQNAAFSAEVAPTSDDPPVEKQKPNYTNTGLLAKEANKVAGTSISLKYHEPAEARKPPPSAAWTMLCFKASDHLSTTQLHERSCWLIGREAKVADVLIEHPSSSGQHAVIQFRWREKMTDTGERKGRVRPYVIDLESRNGTLLNGDKIEAGRYVELRSGDVLKFGESTREYVLMLPPKD